MLRLGRSEAHSSLQKLREDMQSWLIELPYHLHTTNLDSNSGCFRGAVHLHMTYNQIFIYLGRLSLLHQTDRSLHRNHQDGHCDTINLESQSFEQSLARSCVVAAYRVAALMRALTDAQKLAKFSFADMSFCTSATVTILLNEFTESHPSYKRTVSFLMQVMEFFALEGLSNAQNTLHFIRGLQRTVDHVKIENLSRTARSESLRNDSHFADESGNISIGLHGYKSNGDKDHDGEANDDDVYEHWQQWTEEQGKNNGLTSPALSPVAAEPSPSLSRGYIVQGESALSSHAEIGPPHMDLMMPAATYTTQEGFVDMNEEQGTWLFPDTESTRNMPATATSPSELPYLSSWLEDLSAFGLSDLRFADDAT